MVIFTVYENVFHADSRSSTIDLPMTGSIVACSTLDINDYNCELIRLLPFIDAGWHCNGKKPALIHLNVVIDSF